MHFLFYWGTLLSLVKLRWSQLSLGLFSRTRVRLWGSICSLVLMLSLLGACSPVDVAKNLLSNGGGPRVNAQVLAGQEVEQNTGYVVDRGVTIKETQADTIKVNSGDTAVKAERIETIVNNSTPIWLVLLALIGWVLPTPSTCGNWLYRNTVGKFTSNSK